MGILDVLRPDWSKNATDVAKTSEIYIITNLEAFAKAVFLSYNNGREVPLDTLELKVGDTFTCKGKGGGGYPAFQLVMEDECSRVITISSGFRATGNPKNYGLTHITETPVKLLSPQARQLL